MNDETSGRKYLLLVIIAAVAIVSVYVTSMEHPAAPAAAIAKVAPKLPAVSHIVVRSSVTNKDLDISFPYHRDGLASDEKLDFKFTVDYAQGQPTLFHITPDDCVDVLEINNSMVELTGEALAQKCNWQQGFKMDLQPYLHPGANKVHVLVRNTGGWVGLDFAPIVK